MGSDFVKILLSASEEKRLEFKRELVKSDVLATTCAMLNSEGGWILIGIDENHDVFGVADTDNTIREISDSIFREISPLPLVYVQREVYEEKNVIIITVLKGSKQPYSYDGKFYIRTNSTVHLPDSNEISLLLRQSNTIQSSWEKSSCLMANVEDLDKDLLESVMEKASIMGRIKEYMRTDYNEFLASLNFLDTDVVKNGAVAMFAHNANEYLPQCRVRIQVMQDGKTAERYNDIMVIEGNLFELLHKVKEYFESRLPMIANFSAEEWERTTMRPYPMTVIDEAIVNALIHRDYNNYGNDTCIFIYKDRMEIINAGEIPEEILKETKKGNPHLSILRNPIMSEVFFMAGLMEKTGRGMNLIIDEMKKEKCRKPEWKSAHGMTTLTLFPATEKISLGERQMLFISGNKKGSVFSRKDYEAFFKSSKPISSETAKKDIRQMVDAGCCDVVGNGRNVQYIIL